MLLATTGPSIVESVGAPRLTAISTSGSVLFPERRDIYERGVDEKNADSTVKMPLPSFSDSVSKVILELFVVAGWVPPSKTNDITEKT